VRNNPASSAGSVIGTFGFFNRTIRKPSGVFFGLYPFKCHIVLSARYFDHRLVQELDQERAARLSQDRIVLEEL
jgi:hypothetical protein